MTLPLQLFIRRPPLKFFLFSTCRFYFIAVFSFSVLYWENQNQITFFSLLNKGKKNLKFMEWFFDVSNQQHHGVREKKSIIKYSTYSCCMYNMHTYMNVIMIRSYIHQLEIKFAWEFIFHSTYFFFFTFLDVYSCRAYKFQM